MNQVHFQRGSLLYQQGRYGEAIGELRLQLAQGSEDSLTHGLLGLCLAEEEQYDVATEHARQAIHLQPDQAFGYYALAQVMLHRHRYDEALQAILEAIRCNPYDADYFAILASLYLRNSKWREALEAANQGLAIEPEHSLCTNLRAQSLVKLGDRDAAAATMGEALARRPDDPYTHANQGWALLNQGKPYDALTHFREALRLDPEMEWARAGIVEAMKARNFIYRGMLAYFLWMARLQPGIRWGLVVGALVANNMIGNLARQNTALAPYALVVLYAYFAFVLMSWLSYPLFNLLLRFNRFGRYALSADQVRGANVLAACLAGTLSVLVAAIITGQEAFYYGTVLLAILSLPASAIYLCASGWPRQSMAAITLGLLAVIVLVVGIGLFPESQIPLFVLIPWRLARNALPLALLASQFAAAYFMSATPKK
jgi:tetratricopeptide (TPR) repeat protein